MTGLCFRCEHRAHYLEFENFTSPSSDCTKVYDTVQTCWRFKPVRPVIVKTSGDCIDFVTVADVVYETETLHVQSSGIDLQVPYNVPIINKKFQNDEKK